MRAHGSYRHSHHDHAVHTATGKHRQPKETFHAPHQHSHHS
jgi:hypothetical protein